VKRWIIPVLVALAAHGLLFGLDPEWVRPMARSPQNRTLTLSLVDAPPPAVKPLTSAPASAPKAPPPSKPRVRPKPPAPPSVPIPGPIPATPAVTPATPARPAEKSASAVGSGPSPAPLDEPAFPAAASDAADARAQVQASVPLYDRNPPPVYPVAARRRNLEGTVLLEVLVDRDGRAAQVRLLRGSGHAMLDRSALDSVRQWRFTPALRGGRPQEMWVQVPVRFQLK